MKKFLTILGFLFSVAAFAQTSDAVVGALKEGSAVKFTSYFSNDVDVKLPQQNEMKNLTKSNAAGLIQSFFEKNQVTGFELISPPRELNGTTYVAGILKSNAHEYSITVMLKSTGNDMAVITVRIS